MEPSEEEEDLRGLSVIDKNDLFGEHGSLHLSHLKSRFPTMFRGEHGLVKGLYARDGKLFKIIQAFEEGFSVRQAAKISNSAKGTCNRVLRILSVYYEVQCHCGKKRQEHRGWCSYRLRQSKRRQHFLKSRWGKLLNKSLPETGN